MLNLKITTFKINVVSIIFIICIILFIVYLNIRKPIISEGFSSAVKNAKEAAVKNATDAVIAAEKKLETARGRDANTIAYDSIYKAKRGLAYDNKSLAEYLVTEAEKEKKKSQGSFSQNYC